MKGYSREHIGLAVSLSCLSGYVDATAFMATGGLFVSFMSGNSTRLSVSLVENRFAYGALVLGVITLFVVGVMLGTVVSRRYAPRKVSVLLTVCALLTLGAVAHSIAFTYVSTACMVLAMGAVNSVFQRDGEVSIGVSYMTGTLVKLGQNLAGALMGGERDTWWPYALHWLALVMGAVIGARVHYYLRPHSLWVGAGVAFLLAMYARRLSSANAPEPV